MCTTIVVRYILFCYICHDWNSQMKCSKLMSAHGLAFAVTICEFQQSAKNQL